MHLRTDHVEARLPVLQQFVRENPLGLLTTAIKSSQYSHIQVSHIPFVLDTIEASEEPGTLRGHVAKMNPQAKAMIEHLEEKKSTAGSSLLQLDDEVLVLFNAPHHHYVTPKFYTETKPDTGRVVPTWNYSAVQAYGTAVVHYESKAEETGLFLQQQLHDLSQMGETSIMGYDGVDKPGPWKIADAPETYVNLLKKNIIGIEIKIHRLEGRFKLSQEMKEGDRQGVIRGFRNLKTPIGKEMARSVEERGLPKDVGMA
ncbi:hypothetical protein G7046_g1270 [Stylonectria norvegica]|nr:hypothetical protein G7046_g1270 [Stylonectria norvegica]